MGWWGSEAPVHEPAPSESDPQDNPPLISRYAGDLFEPRRDPARPIPPFLTRFLPKDLDDPEEKRIAEGVLIVLGPGAFILLTLAILQPVITDGGFVTARSTPGLGPAICMYFSGIPSPTEGPA